MQIPFKTSKCEKIPSNYNVKSYSGNGSARKIGRQNLTKIYQITLVSVKYNKSRWHFFHSSKPFKLKWVSAKSNKSGLHFYYVLFDLGNSVKLQQVFTI